MAQFSKKRVKEHLKKLGESLQVLNEYQEMPTKVFEQPKECYAVFHAFLVAIQNMMDIGQHILSSLFQTSVTEYKEVIPLLEKNEVISRDLAEKAKGMAEFRNKLVHNYINVDPNIVLGYIKKDLPVFKNFAGEIITFIEKSGV